MGIFFLARRLVFLMKVAGKLFDWADQKTHGFLNRFHHNSNEAERCFQLRKYADAAKYYALYLEDANRRRYSAEKKIKIVLKMANRCAARETVTLPWPLARKR